MLIQCPECELKVSDKANSCPHCGYPMQKEGERSFKKPKKRKSLPNGFGQISEIKNSKLRNRFRVMITVGKKPNGRCIVKPLKPNSYFPTYNEAYAALVEYNKNPYDLEDDITVEQLYERWTSEYFENISQSSTRSISSAWRYCSSIYGMRVKDLRARHIKGCMDEGEFDGKKPTANTKSRIKSMFNIMLDYALEYELVDKNYARTFKVSDKIVHEIAESKNGHMTYRPEEMERLWEKESFPYVDVVLFQCYTGFRPQEIGLIRLDNVDLDKGVIKGGMKTEAGKNRLVPIHPKIRHIVENRYKQATELGSEYLFNCTDSVTHLSSIKFTYDKFRTRYAKIKSECDLNENHRPHDGRMHFITMAKKYNVDEYAIKYIVGHAINDVTEKVYTERDIEWLQTQINLIM